MSQKVIPRVSVVVASHRPGYVGALAQALSSGSGNAEIIVVADYPVDRFAVDYPAVSWLCLDDSSISAKRNAGCRMAKADFLGFIDDDCIPDGGWIDTAVRYLDDHPDIAGVEGKTLVDTENTVAAPMREFTRLQRHGYRTNNIFYRKSVFVEAGGFDERFTVQREDADLAFTVIERGRNIGYCRDIRVRHRVRHNEKWDLLKNCVNRRFDPLLFKKHRALYRKHIGTPFTPAIGLVLFCHVLVLLALVVMPAVWAPVVGADATTALALSVRRNAHSRGGLGWVLRDWLSFLAAPIVLMTVLGYGSARFGKWLMF
jgi:glycosyltransferase involved in cell wall biosynthesis